jgi:NADPH:quinone reductase-like Zn-dependent oxidoreductase
VARFIIEFDNGKNESNCTHKIRTTGRTSASGGRKARSKSNERYDFVFDVVGKTTFTQSKGILKPNGIYLENMLELSGILRMMWTSITGGKKIKGGVSTATAENLNFFIRLFESGKLKPVVDRIYPLEKIAEAYRYVEQGHKKGNVLITINVPADNTD